jgi:transcriptional regulator with XRE-family HTH domain
MQIGKALKISLARAGMTQKQLADRLDVSSRYVGRIAKSSCASISTIEKFAKALGMKASELVALAEE